MNSLKRLAMTLGIGFAAMLAAMPASATVILTFGQSGNGSPIVGTRVGSTTTISGVDIPITITQIDAPLVTPIAAFLNFTTTSIGPAVSVFGFVFQRFAGTFSITNGATNFLSGTLTDGVFGSGASLVLSASMPWNSVTFSSNVIDPAEFGLDQAIALSFANVSPGVSILNGTLRSFTASVSGTFSATAIPRQVPEPASLALFPLAALGAFRFLRRAPA